MSLFNSKKQNVPPCACGGDCPVSESEVSINSCGGGKNIICSIKVLGAGCSSCRAQYENVLQAVKKTGLPAETEYITDFKKITEYGVMSVPAIVINEQVISAGKILKAADVEELLRKYFRL